MTARRGPLLLSAFALLLAPTSWAAEPAAPTAAPEPRPKASPLPGLADLVPRASELTDRKARLESRLERFAAIEEPSVALASLRQRYAAAAADLKDLEASDDYTLDQLARLRAGLQRDGSALDSLVDDLSARMAGIEADRKEWSELATLWRQWEAEVQRDMGPMLRVTFSEAQATAAGSLRRIAEVMGDVVRVQRDAAELQTRFQTLSTRIGGLSVELKGQGLFGARSPPMVAPQFLEQLSASLGALWAGGAGPPAELRPRKWPGWGRFLTLHLLLSAALGCSLRWSRPGDAQKEKWKPLLERPFAAGVLAGVLLPIAFYGPAERLPPLAAFGVVLAGAVAALRVAPRLIAPRPLRRTIAPLVGLFLADRLLRVFEVPVPLLRVLNVFVGLLGASLCFWWAESWRRNGAHRGIVACWRGVGALLALACAAQVSGHSPLGFRLVGGLLMSLFLLPVGWAFASVLRGLTELLLERTILTRWRSVRARRGEVLTVLGRVTDGVTLCLFTSLLLMVWRVVDTPTDAARFLFSLGFGWGAQRLTVGLALLAAAVFCLALAGSRVVQAVLQEEVYPQRRVDPGVRISINRLIHYAFVLVGFFLALGVLGIELGKLTVIAGALGVGIGFGLQNIVNNFVSGIVLLFERPVKVGDVLQLGTDWGTVTRLGLRATTIQTYDCSEIIVPNSELISGRVVNWTHSNRTARIVLPIGVGRGSDVVGVMRMLEEVAAAHPQVAREPSPEAVFLRFGECSLDFQLMAWVWDIDRRLRVQSELLEAVERRFREAGIEIPYPQRVLHRPVQEAGAAVSETEATRAKAVPAAPVPG